MNGTLRLGTCSWTAKGWAGTFYTKTRKPADYLREYAEHFDTVEVDASFYAVPKRETIEHWRDITPPGFLFAAKAPQSITHERFLEGCGDELQRFLDAMSLLGGKCGPLLFQFPYFAKARGVTLQEFLHRLEPFLKLLPKEGFRFAVEVRNKTWVAAPLCDLLAHHGVALALIDHPWMSTPAQLARVQGILTAPFTYVRWLGDRKGIEEVTQVWNEVVVDRAKEIEGWTPVLRSILEKGVDVYGYVNNHYAGYAPHTVGLIRSALANKAK